MKGADCGNCGHAMAYDTETKQWEHLSYPTANHDYAIVCKHCWVKKCHCDEPTIHKPRVEHVIACRECSYCVPVSSEGFEASVEHFECFKHGLYVTTVWNQ